MIIIQQNRPNEASTEHPTSYSAAAHPQHRPSSPTSLQHQPAPHANIRILMDSNRQHIDFKRLLPEANVEIYACGSVPSARSELNSLHASHPVSDILIHVGTNDIETNDTAEEVANNIKGLAQAAARKFPAATIHVSELTPRKDGMHQKAMHVNELLNQGTRSAHIKLIPHNINPQMLHDKKHLSYRYAVRNNRMTRSGTMCLAADFYISVTNHNPSDQHLIDSRREKYNYR